MEKTKTELLLELTDELEAIAIKLARERGIIEAEQEMDLFLHIKPLPIPADSKMEPWEAILSLEWSSRQRKVLEKLRESSLTCGQIAEMFGKRRYSRSWQSYINRKMKEAGLKHRLVQQRTQYSPGKLVHNSLIWMMLAKD